MICLEGPCNIPCMNLEKLQRVIHCMHLKQRCWHLQDICVYEIHTCMVWVTWHRFLTCSRTSCIWESTHCTFSVTSVHCQWAWRNPQCSWGGCHEAIWVVVELRQVRQIESIYQCTVCSYLCANLQLPLLHYVWYTPQCPTVPATSQHHVLLRTYTWTPTYWRTGRPYMYNLQPCRLHDTFGHTHCSNTSILYITKHASIAHAAHNFTVGSPDSNIPLALSWTPKQF